MQCDSLNPDEDVGEANGTTRHRLFKNSSEGPHRGEHPTGCQSPAMTVKMPCGLDSLPSPNTSGSLTW